jgi:hypothetical protein
VRLVGVDLLVGPFTLYDRGQRYATSSGRGGRSKHLLAFHGRSLDLPISTPIPLEVTGEH